MTRENVIIADCDFLIIILESRYYAEQTELNTSIPFLSSARWKQKIMVLPNKTVRRSQAVQAFYQSAQYRVSSNQRLEQDSSQSQSGKFAVSNSRLLIPTSFFFSFYVIA